MDNKVIIIYCVLTDHHYLTFILYQFPVLLGVYSPSAFFQGPPRIGGASSCGLSNYVGRDPHYSISSVNCTKQLDDQPPTWLTCTRTDMEQLSTEGE